MDDFVPICRVSIQTGIFTVKANARWKTLKDLIEEAKKSPGKLTFSSAGVFGTDHFAMETLQKLGKFKATHIPATGVAPALTATLGGHVDFTFSPEVSVSPHIKSGTLRALAVSGDKRLEEFPDVPTFSELGYRVTYLGWYGLVGPKGIPDQVLKTIYDACDKTMEVHKKSIEDQEKKMLSIPAYIKGEEFVKELKSHYDIAKEVFEDLQKSMK